jgi:hypothetical protein
LNTHVSLYKETLEIILDLEPDDAMYNRVPDLSLLEPAAELLYGLIHQRYIITKQGMLQMVNELYTILGSVLNADAIYSMKNMKQANSVNVLESTAMIAIFYLVDSTIYQNRVQCDCIVQIAKTFMYHLILDIRALTVKILC